MSDNHTCNWPGASGQVYQYWWHPMGTTFKDAPGNYIFAHLGPQGWIPDYIGESQSLADRCCDIHEKWERAKRCGATHIHAHTTPGSRERRLVEERDLLGAFSPPCNHQ